MNYSKALSSLSYFSILFAPLLIPLIVWFSVDNQEVKRHSKRAFISHLIPFLLLAATSVYSFIKLSSIRTQSTQQFNVESLSMFPEPNGYIGATPLLIMLLYSFLFLLVLIWNIVQGIKVFKI